MSSPEPTTLPAIEHESGNMTIRVQADAAALGFLPDHVRNPILAFHAEIIGKPDWNWKRVKDAIGYDNSTMSRAFRGKYTGSYPAISSAITAWFDRQAVLSAPSEFVRTPIVTTIFNALDYARANHTGALVIGPSRVGKTVAAKEYAGRKDERRLPISVYIQCRPSGGIGALRLSLCTQLGIAPRLLPHIADSAIIRSIGRNRILIVDEAHRLIGASNIAKAIDYIRWITDEAGCGFAVLATVRFEDSLLDSRYMFEQFIGRVEAPIRVGENIDDQDWHPIVDQFIPGGVKALRPETVQALSKIANSSGHLASIVHVMHLTQRDAGQRKEPIADAHVGRAIKYRREKFNQKFFFIPKGATP